MPWDPIPGPFLFSYRLCTPTAAQHKHSRVRLSNVSTKTSTPIGDHDRTNHLDAYRLSLLHLYRLGVISYGCSRCYLNPLIKVSIYNQWLIISSSQIGIVLNASHDKKLHWGAQRVNT